MGSLLQPSPAIEERSSNLRPILLGVAQVVVVAAKRFHLRGYGTTWQLSAGHDDSRGLASRVGIHDSNSPDSICHSGRFLSLP